MELFKKHILPKVINWACGQNPAMRQREKVIPLAFGKVLEIGIGTGLNLSYYNPSEVKQLTGIDPSEENWKMNKIDEESLGFDFEFVKASAEDMPFDNNQFDSAVITYTLCSIKDPKISLDEINRVLKPSGQLIFCEHGLSPDHKVQRWQNTINPYWRIISGGCNLNRDIPGMLNDGGFGITELETMYLPGWKISSYNYWGIGKVR